MSDSYRTLTGKRRIRRYDFHRPDKFSRENLGALRILHDNMARLLASNLSAHVRSAVRVSLIALDQVTYDEFVEQLQSPVILGLARFEPLEGRVGIELCRSIAHPLLERLLGNSQDAGVMDRELTDIETTVLQTAFDRILLSVQEAWKSVRELDAELESIETSPFFTQFAPPNEMMLIAGFLVEMGEHQDRINVAWPHILLEPVLPDLSVQHWMGRADRRGSSEIEDCEERDSMERHVQDVPIDLTAELGRVSLTIGDLLHVQEGDAVPLNRRIDEPINVYAGDRTVLSGHPGRAGQRYAVRITSKDGEE